MPASPRMHEVRSNNKGFRQRWNGQQWRRMCEVDGCDREAQRISLCARHQPQKQWRPRRSTNNKLPPGSLHAHAMLADTPDGMFGSVMPLQSYYGPGGGSMMPLSLEQLRAIEEQQIYANYGMQYPPIATQNSSNVTYGRLDYPANYKGASILTTALNSVVGDAHIHADDKAAAGMGVGEEIAPDGAAQAEAELLMAQTDADRIQCSSPTPRSLLSVLNNRSGELHNSKGTKVAVQEDSKVFSRPSYYLSSVAGKQRPPHSMSDSTSLARPCSDMSTTVSRGHSEFGEPQRSDRGTQAGGLKTTTSDLATGENVILDQQLSSRLITTSGSASYQIYGSLKHMGRDESQASHAQTSVDLQTTLCDGQQAAATSGSQQSAAGSETSQHQPPHQRCSNDIYGVSFGPYGGQTTSSGQRPASYPSGFNWTSTPLLSPQPMRVL